MIVIEIAVLLSLIITLAVIINRNPLRGSWYIEDRLVYKFGTNGNGVLVLEGDLARFHYEIDGDTLQIDFIEEEYRDCTYRFGVEDDTLQLDNGANGVFTRMK